MSNAARHRPHGPAWKQNRHERRRRAVALAKGRRGGEPVARKRRARKVRAPQVPVIRPPGRDRGPRFDLHANAAARATWTAVQRIRSTRGKRGG